MIKIKTNVGERGFTLIEILLAISILSIVSLCVFNVLRTGLLLGERAQVKSDFYHQIRTTLDLMTEELENMVPYDFSNSYPGRTAFEGSDRKIIFIKADEDRLKVISYFILFLAMVITAL